MGTSSAWRSADDPLPSPLDVICLLHFLFLALILLSCAASHAAACQLLLAPFFFLMQPQQKSLLGWALPWCVDSICPAVKVVLDPDTAHCDLVLSDDCKSVKREDTLQDLPDIPERFNPWRCVLGREGFTSGRYYWEVEVVDGGGWTVGVSRQDVKRKGDIEFKPEQGIWALGQWAGHFQALTSPNRTLLPEIQTPKRIRVSLDYEEGRVTFFSVDEEIPIFTFPLASFEGISVHPWVWLGPGTWLKMWPWWRGESKRRLFWGDLRSSDSQKDLVWKELVEFFVAISCSEQG